MTALSPPTEFERAISAGTAQSRHRPARALRGAIVRRELLLHWLGPVCLGLLLALIHVLGVFANADGRFFDAVTVGQASGSPKVVIVERDAEFESLGTSRFSMLNASLNSIGIERAGYLSEDYVEASASDIPVVVAFAAKELPTNQIWELSESAPAYGSAVKSARSLAPEQYGINRSQSPSLPAQDGVLPVFDAALADINPSRGEYLIPMPRRRSIPILKASQLIGGQIHDGEMNGLVAMVVEPKSLQGSLNTPLDPYGRSTSEAQFRAHSVNALMAGTATFKARDWEVWLLLLALALLLAVIFRERDPKRLAVLIPVSLNVFTIAASWAVLLFVGKLLPVTALLLCPWFITFQRMIARETSQDRRLERSVSDAVQSSFERSALREGARLPQFLASAAQYAGVERSLLVQMLPNGELKFVASNNASMKDISSASTKVVPFLKDVRSQRQIKDAALLVPSWGGETRVGWIGAGSQDLFWIHSKPDTVTPGKSAHLVRAIASSFSEVFNWRAELNARDGHEARHRPIDDRVASAIALVADESGQIRHGYDAITTAITVYHLIGSPLHANDAMWAIYEEAGLNLFDTSLAEALLTLTDLDEDRVTALIEDLMLNGSEMRMPMRNFLDSKQPSERLLRVAATGGQSNGRNRVLVLEAIDMRDANKAADLRKAVAKFIDLQLRNDLESILLGSQLAGDKRLDTDQIDHVVGQISDTARRATGRLDEVAGMIRSEVSDLTEACYPVDATSIIKDAVGRTSAFADELGVVVKADHPDVVSFIIAEPNALKDMLIAMLRVIIADTPHGGVVNLKFEECDGRAIIRVTGGFGIAFDRLLWLIANYEEGAVGEFRAIGEGIKKVTSWSASVSYWGSGSNGLGFNIDLRGVG
ncbi:MAG: hypothetical protein AAGK17_10155 [Pseudomonadota bacterium]